MKTQLKPNAIKKLLILFVSCMLYVNTYAQFMVFEDFNSGTPPAGWSTVVNFGDCDFEFGTDLPTGDNFPTTAWFYDDTACGPSSPAADLYIQSATYDLSTATTATLTVDIAFQVDEAEGGQSFQILAWNGSDWVYIDIFGVDLDPDIQTFTYDVSPYVNGNMSFRFIYYDNGNNSNGSYGYHGGIDNFLLQSDALGIEDNTIAEFNMYPNPADDVLNISAYDNIDQVVVYDMLGRKILEQTLNSNSSEINVSSFNTGAYLIQVNSGNKSGTYQFLKK